MVVTLSQVSAVFPALIGHTLIALVALPVLPDPFLARCQRWNGEKGSEIGKRRPKANDHALIEVAHLLSVYSLPHSSVKIWSVTRG
jgi:hypothetical protein